MKLKGNYNSGVSYSVGDIVKHSDGFVYILQKPAPAGTDPKDVLYWNMLHQSLADAVVLIVDALVIAQDAAQAAAQSEVEKYFLNDQTLLLKAGEGESEKTYAITVDDSGDTPELDVAEVSDSDGGEG
ncbi:MAG: hypothetical protein J6Y20_10225 [Lachnospiraceae bacterium]|nr:hypothetical protein [Lachnospiraceae bacterium]MBP5462490.1 hypothetical protein [Lachnospiraceae bacterium]